MGEAQSTMAATKQILGVQYLRALAALMVVYFHAMVEVPRYTAVLDGGHLIDAHRLQDGVHVFFVISGFIMILVSIKENTPAKFLTRRLIRIVPLYWLLTTALVFLAILPPHFFSHVQVTPEFYLQSMLFIPYAAPTGAGQPLLVPGWTLNIEMTFYLIFAVALLCSEKRRLEVAAVLLLMVVASGSFLRSPLEMPHLWTLTRPWMLEFVAGMVIAKLYLERRLTIPRWLCGVLVIGGFALLLGPWSHLHPGIPSTLIVLGAVGWERSYVVPQWSFALLLGDASYSLYLSHIFTLGALKVIFDLRWLADAGKSTHAIAFAAVGVALSIAVGVVIYLVVEKPVLRWLHAKEKQWQAILLTR